MHVTLSSAAPDSSRPPVTELRSWMDFERTLAISLQSLDREILVIDVTSSPVYVQFAVSPSAVQVETVSNEYLREGERLSEAQVAALLDLGWSPPLPAPADPGQQDGPKSPNFSRHLTTPDRWAEAARLAVRTLAEVHGVSGPDRLVYRSFDDDGIAVMLPELHRTGVAEASSGQTRPRRVRSPVANVRRRLLREMRRLTGDPGLTFDRDGDLPFPMEGGRAFVRVLPAPPLVRAWCILATEVPDSPDFLRRVHEANAKLPLARLVLTGGTLFAAVDVPAAPFLIEHLKQAWASLHVVVTKMGPQFRNEHEAVRARRD